VISCKLSLTNISGKSIRQRDPGKLALGPGMVLGPNRFRIIHASQCHVDRAGQVGALIGQGCSTCPTESANNVRRRRIGSRLPRNEREFICIKSSPSDKWRAARAPASFAVAMRNPVRLPGCAVANRATKTSTFYKVHVHPPSGSGTILTKT
jgi:hypothetical protein